MTNTTDSKVGKSLFDVSMMFQDAKTILAAVNMNVKEYFLSIDLYRELNSFVNPSLKDEKQLYDVGNSLEVKVLLEDIKTILYAIDCNCDKVGRLSKSLDQNLRAIVGDNDQLMVSVLGQMPRKVYGIDVYLSKGPIVKYPMERKLHLIDQPVPMRWNGNGNFGFLTFFTDLSEMTQMIPNDVQLTAIIVHTNSIYNLCRAPSYPNVSIHFLTNTQPPPNTLLRKIPYATINKTTQLNQHG